MESVEKHYWMPQTADSAHALIVETRVPDQEMSRGLRRSLIEDKLIALIVKDGITEAARVLELAAEYNPELLGVSWLKPSAEMAMAIMRTDCMAALLSQIDWQREALQPAEDQDTLREIAQEQSLQSLLESV